VCPLLFREINVRGDVMIGVCSAPKDHVIFAVIVQVVYLGRFCAQRVRPNIFLGDVLAGVVNHGNAEFFSVPDKAGKDYFIDAVAIKISSVDLDLPGKPRFAGIPGNRRPEFGWPSGLGGIDGSEGNEQCQNERERV